MSWWKEGVVYQIYPRSYVDSTGNGVGDLRGIISRLDYLTELGVNIVWLNPIYASPNDDNGYDISDYEAIMSEFGTMADFDELLEGLHQRGIRLIMDLVVNHSSDEHPWFIESRNPDSAYRDYYIWRDGKSGRAPNNWVSVFSGPAWEYDQASDQYFLHLFSKKQPDLNWENPDLRQDIYAMMRRWFERGVDGFRMDVINMISKNPSLPSVGDESTLAWGGEHFMNGPRFHEYMQEMHREVLADFDCMTVGECFDLDVNEGRKLVGEDRNELSMVFQMEHMSLDHGNGKWDVQPDWSRVRLKEILNRWIDGLDGVGWNSQFWMNHDQPRAVSRFGNDADYRVESAKALAAVTLTLPGTPYIYMGEEIGMTNVAYPIEDYRDLEIHNWYNEQVAAGQNPEALLASVHRMGRDNARTPMQWDASTHAGFTSGTPWLKVNPNYPDINVAADRANPDGIWHWYRDLIALRKARKTLVYGRYEPYMIDSEQLFAFRRQDQQGDFLVLINLSDERAITRLPESVTELAWQVVKNNYPGHDRIDALKPWQALILELTD
ncbi:alpha-glucosidase [Reinekea blandensis]|uniref:Oligo-1,6-glucosidase n=1 Tax=Reinekea blandensis MED297 TaxID=314283 RepID=A4BE28_9GAMM|nr:alpha-glucosidase [Reinekea blandensis]EAR09506.1 oligo-1,6-glucosidase [Reinekea blandensis MED297]